MKKLVIIMGVMALVGGIVIALLLFKGISSIGAGCIEAADGLMTAATAGDYTKASAFLSESYRASDDEAALRAFMTATRLNTFAEATWTSRRIKNSQGWLEGTVQTKTGGKIPVKMEFIDEGGWKVVSITTPQGTAPRGGAFAGNDVPSKDEQTALIRRSFRDFAASLRQGTMKSFHATLSTPFRDQFPPERLDSIYTPFYKVTADWTLLDTIDPILDSPVAVDSNGVLLLAGHFPTTPDMVRFSHKYVWEGGEWKLLGFNVFIGGEK